MGMNLKTCHALSSPTAYITHILSFASLPQYNNKTLSQTASHRMWASFQHGQHLANQSCKLTWSNCAQLAEYTAARTVWRILLPSGARSLVTAGVPLKSPQCKHCRHKHGTGSETEDTVLTNISNTGVVASTPTAPPQQKALTMDHRCWRPATGTGAPIGTAPTRLAHTCNRVCAD